MGPQSPYSPPPPLPVTDFLRDLFSRPGAVRTVIVLEPDSASAPRQYEVRPGVALYGAVIGSVLLAVALVAAIVLTSLRGLLLGPDVRSLRTVASANAQRAAALEDSLSLQYQQIAQLRAIITGEIDDLGERALDPSSFSLPDLGDRPDLEAPASLPAQGLARDHRQPALPLSALGPSQTRDAALAYLDRLRLPVPPPVDGVTSRGFDAARGHLALDLAAAEGSPVRAFGDGHVVLADWTHDGGLTIVVQHPGGYLSVYKHNRRLLKSLGDRVLARETVALSGNTGEVTSGPHLHFEVWRDGLAQDPSVLLL